MDASPQILCPTCQAATTPEAYFCSQCGKPVREKPLAATFMKQLWVYGVCLFAPPFGLWYTWKYLRQAGSTAKKIGIATIVLTIISIVFTIWVSASLLNQINTAVNNFGSMNNFSF